MTAFAAEFIIRKVFSAALRADQKKSSTAFPAKFSGFGIFSPAIWALHDYPQGGAQGEWLKGHCEI